MTPKSSLPGFQGDLSGIKHLDLALPFSGSKAKDEKPPAPLKSTLPMIPPFGKAINKESLDLPKSTISMPKIDFGGIDYLPEILHEDAEMRSQLGSQGLFVSDDGSYAYSHESTYPDVCFIVGDKLPCAVNMDRGGVATRVDGTHAACIADGVGGAGFFSAFVAHGICQYVIGKLSKGSIGFGNQEGDNKKTTERLFQDSFNSLGGLQNCHLKGSTTILFAECVSTNQNGVYKLYVGALGDGAVIHIDSKKRKALQLNAIHRELDKSGKPDVRCSGGQINIDCGIVDRQNIEAKVIEIDEDDYVVLVTDGFLDNVLDDRISEMVELVAYNPFFDQSLLQLFGYLRFWEEDRLRLPTVEEMTMFIDVNETSIMNEETELTAEKITKRLAAYTALVTHSFQIKQEDYYMDMGGHPLHYYDSPKTDDAMIIVMSPIVGKK